ncbi:hypothetical protein Pcinc_039570 [Petrolisthes cinctipes]|uniref:Uncharacterized protein n=1 Tax=Petrolisthes cinctipes TaxID=88211 RepID=A0AAE1BNB7_PETCI|nr:hypothetical protein Pcinc_039570 [Petrolisthes cinctipes]
MLSCGVEATGPERVRSGDPAHTTLCSDLTARAGCGKEEEERAGDRKRGYGGGWGVGREGSGEEKERAGDRKRGYGGGRGVGREGSGEEESGGDRKREYGGGRGVGREGKGEGEIGKEGMGVCGELEERVVVRRRRVEEIGKRVWYSGEEEETG